MMICWHKWKYYDELDKPGRINSEIRDSANYFAVNKDEKVILGVFGPLLLAAAIGFVVGLLAVAITLGFGLLYFDLTQKLADSYAKMAFVGSLAFVGIPVWMFCQTLVILSIRSVDEPKHGYYTDRVCLKCRKVVLDAKEKRDYVEKKKEKARKKEKLKKDKLWAKKAKLKEQEEAADNIYATVTALRGICDRKAKE